MGADIYGRELRCCAFKLSSKSVLFKLCSAVTPTAVRCKEGFCEKASVMAKLFVLFCFVLFCTPHSISCG